MLIHDTITQLNNLLLDFDLFNKLGAKFFFRFAINFLSVFILIRLIYYPIYRKKDYFFTYFLFNVVIFIITYLLNKVELSMGAAFGLFAVFSLLRYRTVNISAKDMTYLFIVIALGLISAVAKGTYFETILINSIILTCAYFLDGNLFMKNENTQKVQYENIEMIRPENHELLIEDLKKRTGLNIHRISISKINFMKDTAVVKIYYLDNNEQKVMIQKATTKSTSLPEQSNI
ncbi:MAG: DUF4956 domain-containing protein [Bacteroidota bacterium]|nr:DUF4956 domain-containing protein [Bacteroidota bacterium]